MKSMMFYVGLIVLFCLVTFFGLGPVLFADGTMQERILTLGVVLLCYAIIAILWWKWAKIITG